MLPKIIDPTRLTKQGAAMRGEVRLADLPRLQILCDQGDRVAHVALQLGTDDHGVPFVHGEIKGVVHLACQRCNGDMQETLDFTFQLSPVASDAQAKKLPEPYEPLVMQDNAVVIAEMIEDEILLALPMVSKHSDGVC